MKTLGCLLLLTNCLTNMIYKEWLEVPMIFLPSLDTELGIV